MTTMTMNQWRISTRRVLHLPTAMIRLWTATSKIYCYPLLFDLIWPWCVHCNWTTVIPPHLYPTITLNQMVCWIDEDYKINDLWNISRSQTHLLFPPNQSDENSSNNEPPHGEWVRMPLLIPIRYTFQSNQVNLVHHHQHHHLSHFNNRGMQGEVLDSLIAKYLTVKLWE